MRLKFISALTALKCLAWMALMLAAVGAVLLVPVIFVIATRGMLGWMTDVESAAVRFVYVAVLLYWILFVTQESVKTILAIRRKGVRFQEPMLELPAERQPVAADLIRVMEAALGKGLKGRMRVYLTLTPTLAPGVSFRKDPKCRGNWQLGLGLPVLAVLTQAEVEAMALQAGFEQLLPVSPFHPWLGRLRIRVHAWHAALPPDSGLSVPHNMLEFGKRLLEPVFLEQSGLSRARVGQLLSVATVSRAVYKMGIVQRRMLRYVNFYRSALSAGGMAPFAEGFYRMCGKKPSTANAGANGVPCFTLIKDLWVYEQRLTRGFVDAETGRNLKLIDWDDFYGEFLIKLWKPNAEILRPALGEKYAADIPELIAGWRDVAQRSMGGGMRLVTPDVQRGFVVHSLGGVLVIVMMKTGWQLASSFGEEVRFCKGAKEFRPIRMVHDVANGRLGASEYLRACQDASTDGLPLF